MEKTILNFAKQFEFRLKVQSAEKLKPAENIIVVGMGGSAFPAEILKTAHPELNITNHRSYDLPHLTSNIQRQTLVITSSYSGTTEETLSSFEKAIKQKLNLTAVTMGGKLLALAKKYKVPYIQIPDTKIQPRMSTGFFVAAFSKLIGLKNEKELASLSKTLKPIAWQKKGKALSENLWDQLPVIYASEKNSAIAQVWKIKFNENGKIPAFWNFLPEMNHNEMTGYDATKTTASLSSNLHLIFLEDSSDHPRIKKRFSVTKKILGAKGLNLTSVPLSGKNIWEKVFNSLLLADWASLYLARYYGNDPEQVPMVEEFKKLIR
ncbi:MAG: bifunctional phosphoglucose/phosphomannose isomerase [Patescibacteria group bacterium]